MPKRPSPPKIRGLRQRGRQKPQPQDLTTINLRAMKKRHALLEARVEALERTVKLWTDGVHLDHDMPQATGSDGDITAHTTDNPVPENS